MVKNKKSLSFTFAFKWNHDLRRWTEILANTCHQKAAEKLHVESSND